MKTLSTRELEPASVILDEEGHGPAYANWRPTSIVMTRTPLRVSFAGGGTDLPEFYEVEEGAVLSAAVDKYVYVTVKRHSDLFNEPIRLNYSRTEQVNTIAEIDNNIARECLKFLSIEPPIFISTVADMPASTGMGDRAPLQWGCSTRSTPSVASASPRVN